MTAATTTAEVPDFLSSVAVIAAYRETGVLVDPVNYYIELDGQPSGCALGVTALVRHGREATLQAKLRQPVPREYTDRPTGSVRLGILLGVDPAVAAGYGDGFSGQPPYCSRSYDEAGRVAYLRGHKAGLAVFAAVNAAGLPAKGYAADA